MRPRTRLAFGRPFRQRLRQRPMGVDRAVRASSQVCCKTDRGSPNPKRLLAGHNRGTRRLSCRAEPTHLPLRLFFSSGKLHQAAPDACRRDRGRRDLSRRDWQQDASGMRRTEFGIFPVFRGLSGRLQVRPPVAYATEQEALRAAEYFASILGGAIAYSRVIDREAGTAEDGVIIGRFGVLADPQQAKTRATG
jgi:hypothetical protein